MSTIGEKIEELVENHSSTIGIFELEKALCEILEVHYLRLPGGRLLSKASGYQKLALEEDKIIEARQINEKNSSSSNG